MPLLQQHPDSLWRDERSPPDTQLGLDLPQQIQNCVAELPVLQLDPVVFSRHSDAGKPEGGVGKPRSAIINKEKWQQWPKAVDFCNQRNNSKPHSFFFNVNCILHTSCMTNSPEPTNALSPSLYFIHLVSRNHDVSILIHVLEGLESLDMLWHLLQTNLQKHQQ